MTAPNILPSAFDVTGLAIDSVGDALGAIAGLWGRRNSCPPPPVAVDPAAACAAFGPERHQASIGWEIPAPWEAIAGDYRTADGWIKLHTNYQYHRAAVEAVLGPVATRAQVAELVSRWTADELEAAVVAAGGAAAALHTEDEWAASGPGKAVADEPLVSVVPAADRPTLGPSERPLSGVRVLDLTRVIAGPTATSLLAAYGADVIRIDPPGFAEVEALLPIVTAGKKCAFLDLKGDGRGPFEELVRRADVLITSLRPDALPGLGYSPAELWSLNPELIIGRNAAYGWTGPQSARRGFDSLVQMSSGIAATGMDWASADRPTPLPVQALDFATGYLLAGACVRALADSRATEVRVSLARTAHWLRSRPRPTDEATGLDPSPHLARFETHWGPIDQVRTPGGIKGCEPAFGIEAGPLGRHEARWDDQ